MSKKIIGYKAPYDLFGGEVKAGTEFKATSSHPTPIPKYTPIINGNVVGFKFDLPKEIVETWEPIYKINAKVVTYSDLYNDFFQLESGKWTTNLAYEYNEEDLLKRKDIIIKRVKRLSDGEIFELQEKVSTPMGGGCRIYEFKFVNGDIAVDCTYSHFLNKEELDFWDIVEKIKPLFITEDGKETFEGDKIFVPQMDTKDWNVGEFFATSLKSGDKSKIFSTKEAAEKYILDNKPIFSKKQIEEALDQLDSISYSFNKDSFRYIIKQKLGI